MRMCAGSSPYPYAQLARPSGGPPGAQVSGAELTRELAHWRRPAAPAGRYFPTGVPCGVADTARFAVCVGFFNLSSSTRYAYAH